MLTHLLIENSFINNTFRVSNMLKQKYFTCLLIKKKTVYIYNSFISG